MTISDRPADDTAPDGEADDEDGGPPYGRLDPETASKCGLWLE